MTVEQTQPRLAVTMNLYPEEYELIAPGKRCPTCGHLESLHIRWCTERLCKIESCECGDSQHA